MIIKQQIFKIVFILSLLTITNCEKKPDDHWNKMLALYALNYGTYINNCPAPDAVLTSGTHSIELTDGKEFWFDIAAKGDASKALNNYYAFDIYIKYSPNSELKIFNGNCMVNNVILNRLPPKFTPNRNLTVGPLSNGYYITEGYFPINDNTFYSLVGLKLEGSSGTVSIIAP